MTSGLAFSNDRFSLEIYAGRPADPAAYILRKPLMAAPGERFDYRDCDPHLLSFLIQRQTGRTEAEWAAARLFAPLGIREWYWATDPAGTTTGAHGLHLKPRDLAKLGQLVLDHGRWGEVQVVDSAWVAASTQQQIAVPEQRPGRLYEYGFYWWILPRRDAFSAWGHGGNFICVVPAKRMVLVMTSMPDVDDEVVGSELDDFEDLVAPLLALP
jgi:CubicO group peptidase (beta-lactamase class C family)